MTSKRRLAEWIERGLRSKGFKEDKCCFLSGHWCDNESRNGTSVSGCALGAALVGRFGAMDALRIYREKRNELVCHRGNSDFISLFPELLGISKRLTLAINELHHYGTMSAKEIAAGLKKSAI